MKHKVLFFGTHPKQFNGYSKVVYELAKVLQNSDKLDFNIFGFQNFYENGMHRKDIPQNMYVYDAFANEEPKQQGFGVDQVRKVVAEVRPDICVVYNDMLVIHQIVSQLKLAQQTDGIKFKICAYIDQVYLNQKKEFIDFVNNTCDYAIMFTEFWETNIKEQGLKLRSSFLPHGFNKMTYFPVPKELARQYFGLKPDDYIILNLNRNQPRKRWDICLKAFAEIVARYPNEPIKLMIATAVQGAWNLIEIFERELKKRGLTLEDGIKHLIIIDNPQRITDEETNILYNVADLGINTCDGEGFGLCQFEEAGIGIPQIVPRLGGFTEYFDDHNSILVDPKIAYYVDNTRDMVCGEALLCDYADFVDAFENYYTNKDVKETHGMNARKGIVSKYSWEDIARKFETIMDDVMFDPNEKKDKAADDKVNDIKDLDVKDLIKVMDEEVEQIDIDSLSKIKPIKTKTTKSKLKKKLKKKDKNELLKLKKKLEKLLESSSDDDDSTDT